MANGHDMEPGDKDRSGELVAKLRRVLARVPFAETLLAVQYAARDPRTPAHVRATLLAALAYFVMPADLIPDFIAGFGFTDDAAVLAAAVRMLSPHITEDHYEKARRLLRQMMH